MEAAKKQLPKQLVGDNEHLLLYRIPGGLDDEALVDLLSYMQKIAFIFNARMLFRRDGTDRLLLLSFLGQKEARYAQENIAANWPEGLELEDVPETRGEGFGAMSEGIYPEEIGLRVADRVARDPDALRVMLEGMLDRPPGDYLFDVPEEVKQRVRAAREGATEAAAKLTGGHRPVHHSRCVLTEGAFKGRVYRSTGITSLSLGSAAYQRLACREIGKTMGFVAIGGLLTLSSHTFRRDRQSRSHSNTQAVHLSDCHPIPIAAAIYATPKR